MTVAFPRRPAELEAFYSGSQLPAARGATAGIPGSWTPAGSIPPATPADLQGGRPVTVTASPATPWTTGQFVQTRLAGAPGRATWTGTGWVGGVAATVEVEAPQAQGGSSTTPTRRRKETA